MKLPLQAKVTAFIIVVVIALGVVSTLFFISLQKRGIERQLITRGITLAESLARAVDKGLASENLELIKQVQNIVHTRDVNLAQVYSTVWLPVDAYPFTEFDIPPDPGAVRHFDSSDRPYYTRDGQWFDFYTPVFYDQFEIAKDRGKYIIGFVRLRISNEEVRKAMREAIMLNIVLSLLMALIVVSIINTLTRNHLLRPILNLHRAVSRYKRGELAEPIPVSAGDEIGELSEEVNAMIKALREREEMLAEEKEALRSITDNAPNIILKITRDGTITYINRVLEGFDQSTLIGLNMYEFIHEEYRGGVREKVERVFTEGVPESYEVVGMGLKRKDAWYSSHIGPVFDSKGNAEAAIIVSTDITERKESEEALRESEKKIRDITASLGEGIYVLDREGTITFMNPMAERLWGWTMEELNETRAHNRVHFQGADGTPLPIEECRMLKVLKTGIPFSSTDEVFIRKDGTVFPISVITTPIIEGERVVGSVTAFRDITEEKKMETELLKAHKLESLGILAGGIAHDFNNLLQAIVGNISLAKMLLGTGTPEEVPALLVQAEEASEAARELSFRLLTFSKGGEPVRKTSSIGAIIRKSVSLSLSGSAITCTVDLPPDLCPVEIDEGQMTQVFNNLLINAKEAMPQGGTIIIRGENLFLPGDSPLPLNEGAYVSIMVQDSGLGIPEEILPKIFDPYFSAKGLGSRNGSGLGLAIALSIVKKHEGHISVDSRKGKGTIFRVYLPVSKGPLEVQKREEAAPRDLSPKRLLFMDDDERIRRLLRTMMEHLGYDYELAGTGEEALERFRRAKESGETFDAVILDLTVQGGMGGEKAVRRLREIDPGVKAIVSSGYADDPVMKDYRAYGFAGAIAKPYTIDKLTELLAKV